MKKVIAIVGPSGSGKTYLSKILISLGIPKCVTATTRRPREMDSEVHGEDYYFLTEDEFKSTDFVESTTYNSNSYGLPTEEVIEKLKESDTIHVVVDQKGAKSLQKRFPIETKVVYLMVTEETMRLRMAYRGDGNSEIEARISHAQENGEFNIPGVVDFVYDAIGGEDLEELLAFIKGDHK